MLAMTPVSELADLARGTGSRRVLEVLGRRRGPEYMQMHLALVRNPKTPIGVLESLVDDPDVHEQIRGLVVAIRRLSDESVVRLAGDPATPRDVIFQIATGPLGAPEQAHALLMGSKDVQVRLMLAMNESATAETLEVLARDPYRRVRTCVVAHPAASASALDVVLAQVEAGDDEDHGDEEWALSPARVRAMAAVHPNLSVGAMRALAVFPDPEVRLAVAGNPSLPEDLRALLQQDPDERVGRAADPLLADFDGL